VNNAGPQAAADPRIWTLEDLPLLAAYRPVAAGNVSMIPVHPSDANEENAQLPHGDYVRRFTATTIPSTVYMGEPIHTTERGPCMRELYPGAILPPLPTS
jgi:hypothetical protein